QSARAALTAKRLDDAAKSANDALKLMPNDKDALTLLKEIDKARADAKAIADAEARKRDDFNRLLTQAQAAANAKKYDEALRLYGDALKLMPNDATALKGQRDATAAKSAIDAEAKKRDDFNRLMK